MPSNTPNNTKAPKPGLKPRTRAIIRWMWICFVVCVLFLGGFFLLAYNGVIGYMPPIEDLKNPQDKFASVIYSSDGVELGRYFRNTGNRVYADFDEISPAVVDALIATEDARFEEHSGIDVRALIRVAFKTVLMGQRNAGGGSRARRETAAAKSNPRVSWPSLFRSERPG